MNYSGNCLMITVVDEDFFPSVLFEYNKNWAGTFSIGDLDDVHTEHIKYLFHLEPYEIFPALYSGNYTDLT